MDLDLGITRRPERSGGGGVQGEAVDDLEGDLDRGLPEGDLGVKYDPVGDLGPNSPCENLASVSKSYTWTGCLTGISLCITDMMDESSSTSSSSILGCGCSRALPFSSPVTIINGEAVPLRAGFCSAV